MEKGKEDKKKSTIQKVKMGMRSEWGRERWWETNEVRKRNKKEKLCSREQATVIL